MKTLYKSADCMVEIEDPIIYIDNKRWGFRMTDDEGIRRIVVHKKIVEKSNDEFGFLVPTVLIKCSMLFEVKFGPEKYTHYHYYPKMKNRLIPVGDFIFIGLGPLERTDKAEHIKKVK